ncbi:sensor histidine kinase [Dongia sp.]|uniref:sensor histidine kinase n=1 Tax=Dongia sp. TaxID=1977262 RepID=UPI0037517794
MVLRDLLMFIGMAAAVTDLAVALVLGVLWHLDRRPYLLIFGVSFAAVALSLVASTTGRLTGQQAYAEPLADLFYIASVAVQIGGCLILTGRRAAWSILGAGAAALFLLAQVGTKFGVIGFFYLPALSGAVYVGLGFLLLAGHRETITLLLGLLYMLRAVVNLAWPLFRQMELGAVIAHADQVMIVTIALVLVICDLSAARRRAEHITDALTRQADALKVLNVQLAEERTQADAANRAKSQFLANMSHELRTPLNAVIGFSDMMSNSRVINAAGSTTEYARLIHSAGQHLLGIINDVLDMARIESGKITVQARPMNLRTALDAVMGLTIHQARARRISFSTQIDDGAVAIEGDEQLLKQVLTNLLSNAFKYTEPGGAVRLEAAADGLDEIRITVTDTGLGIAAKDLPHIFEPFVFSGSAMTRRRGGIGLGLSITKRLVELHGGTIAIASTLGKGTTVTIVLPKQQEAAASPAEAAPAPSTP